GIRRSLMLVKIVKVKCAGVGKMGGLKQRSKRLINDELHGLPVPRASLREDGFLGFSLHISLLPMPKPPVQ
ncbi:MAG: hypothetical protein V1915_03520, partial [Candidatus Bathyarchaeota archaeon]